MCQEPEKRKVSVSVQLDGSQNRRKHLFLPPKNTSGAKANILSVPKQNHGSLRQCLDSILSQSGASLDCVLLFSFKWPYSDDKVLMKIRFIAIYLLAITKTTRF